MPKPASGKRRPPKTRSHKLGGCLTCRRRHVKCDHAKPICGICAATGLHCDGYQTSLQWAADGAAAKDETNTRSYLYSEEERRHMTKTLATDLIEGCVDTSLDRLDDRAKDGLHSARETLSVGPFGVFNAEQRPPAPPIVQAVPVLTNDEQKLPVNPSGSTPAPAWDAFPDIDFNFNVGKHLDWADLFNFDIDAANIDFNYDHTSNAAVSEDVNWPASPAYAAFMNLQNVQTPRATIDNAAVSLMGDNAEWTDEEVLNHAPLLLRNFRINVLPCYSAIPVDAKSPWELLNLNSAIKTLADLTYMQSPHITFATRANLFAILACSAQHMYMTEDMSSPSPPERMLTLIAHCGWLAKKNMQLTLRHETRPPGQAKYKDQLMAILGMIAYATAVGNQNDARCYVVDSEKLLRIRGLEKQDLSRRTRLLHHVYTWVRLIGESTYVLHDLSNAALIDKINAIVGADSHASPDSLISRPAAHAELDDFLRVVPDPASEDEGPKSREAGLRDIHLEDNRKWSTSFFMRIAGIPETCMSLISQTTRFANVQELIARHPQLVKPATAASIARKIDRLEHMVCTFTSEPPPPAEGVRRHMLAALYSALLVFFYRRVRNLHPLVLQPHVAAVVAELAQCREHWCTPWPAFIAGCEADRQDHREVLAGWMQRSATASGQRSYADALEVMREVWRRREGQGRKTVSWVDVARELRVWPMLY